jgi:hypothetical protein
MIEPTMAVFMRMDEEETGIQNGWRRNRNCWVLTYPLDKDTAIRVTQGKGLVPDGTSRCSYRSKPIFPCMGIAPKCLFGLRRCSLLILRFNY